MLQVGATGTREEEEEEEEEEEKKCLGCDKRNSFLVELC
jgi:hypothetical protein